ncbi:MAG TPA: S53 family peptidase [Candidatus Binatia bacterium]|jgi:kumamolisin|nr:S53 family peptidase [Candidatus Binatia bacterium]
MALSKQRTILAGSDKQMLPRAKPIGKVDPHQQLEITVLLRPRAAATYADRAMQLGGELPADRQYLSRQQLSDTHGADPADVAQIDAFAHAHHLTIVQTHLERRTVRLAGTVADLTSAFRPNLKNYRLGTRAFRGRTGPLSLPKELDQIVLGVFGFDNRPVAQPHYRRAPAARKTGRASPRNATGGSFTPPEVAALYDFPAGLDGSGQCIALIELNDMDKNGNVTGTGYAAADLQTYFQKLKLPLPPVAAIGVGGGRNAPGPDPNADGEVMLDIEVAGAVAPAANIAVYFAPDTDQGFLDAIHAAVHDDVRKPSVISISWGSSEDSWTDQFRSAFDQAFQDAAMLGVTVCCAAGDNGSADQGTADRDGSPHVDFPASSPFALACGGTKLLGSGTRIANESVWNEGNAGGAGGGGVSNCFPPPAYQTALKVPLSPNGKPGRGVPDVAGDADPQTGYQVRVGGQNTVIGGTSAVAPLFAGLLARINQQLAKLSKPPVGFMNPILYKNPGVFHDIVEGNNDIDGSLRKYNAGPGWDACTGLGSPDGATLMQTLGA